MRAMARCLCTQPDVKRSGPAARHPEQRAYSPKRSTPVLEGCGKEVSTTYVPDHRDGPHAAREQGRCDQARTSSWCSPLAGPQAVQITRPSSRPASRPIKTVARRRARWTTRRCSSRPGAVDGGRLRHARAQSPERHRRTRTSPSTTAAMEGAGLYAAQPQHPDRATCTSASTRRPRRSASTSSTAASLKEYLNTRERRRTCRCRAQLVNPGPEGCPQIKQPYAQMVQWKDGKLTPVTEGTEDGWIKGF